MEKHINNVDVNLYQGFINRYNALPVSKRENWRENGMVFPYDEPTLYYTSKDGETIEDYILQVIPEWAISSDSIEAYGTEDAKNYYLDEPTPDSLFKQNLKLIVVHHNFQLMYSEEIEYQNQDIDFEFNNTDFISRMKLINQANNFNKLSRDTSKLFTLGDTLKLLDCIPERLRDLQLYVYDITSDQFLVANGIDPYDVNAQPSIDNPVQINYVQTKYLKRTVLCSKVLRVNDVINYLKTIPRKLRDLPLYVYDYSTDLCLRAISINTYYANKLPNDLNPLRVNFKGKKGSNIQIEKKANTRYGLNFNNLMKLSTFGKPENREYYAAFNELFKFNELADEIDDFNNEMPKGFPRLKCCQNRFYSDTYVYFDRDVFNKYNATEINNLIRCFCGQASWSEYSAQFDSDDDYIISEDRFIDHAKNLVNDQLIQNF